MVGILTRENGVVSLPISAGTGKNLQILVENQGRINFDMADDFKGIIGNITLNKKLLYGWNTTGFPLDDSSKFNDLSSLEDENEQVDERSNAVRLKNGPLIFKGSFHLSANDIHDTYINPVNWGKVNNDSFRINTYNGI